MLYLPISFLVLRPLRILSSWMALLTECDGGVFPEPRIDAGTRYHDPNAAPRMMRETIETLGPPGALISEEAVLAKVRSRSMRRLRL